MAKLEDNMQLDGDWGGIEQLTPKTRVGYTQNFVMVERTLDELDENGNPKVGVYNLPHVPSERMADFLVWLANLEE